MLSVSDLVSSEESDAASFLLSAPAVSLVGDAASEHQAQTDLKVAQLVRRVITTAYETCDGEPTLLVLLQTHTALTSQLNSAFDASVNALAYNMIIDISLSHENGGWWDKLETLKPRNEMLTQSTNIFDDSMSSEDEDDVLSVEEENKSAMMLEAVHNWLSVSFPRRQYPCQSSLPEHRTVRTFCFGATPFLDSAVLQSVR